MFVNCSSRTTVATTQSGNQSELFFLVYYLKMRYERGKAMPRNENSRQVFSDCNRRQENCRELITQKTSERQRVRNQKRNVGLRERVEVACLLTCQ